MKNLILGLLLLLGCSESNQNVKLNEFGEKVVNTQKVERHGTSYHVNYSMRGSMLYFTFAFDTCWYDIDDTVAVETQGPARYVSAPYVGSIEVHDKQLSYSHRVKKSESFTCKTQPYANAAMTLHVGDTSADIGTTDDTGKLAAPTVPPMACYDGNATYLADDARNVRLKFNINGFIDCVGVEKDQYEMAIAADTMESFKLFTAHFPRSQFGATEAMARLEAKAEAEERRIAAEAEAKQKAEEAKAAAEAKAEARRQAKAEAEDRARAAERNKRQAEENEQRERDYVASCGDTPTVDHWHGIPTAAYKWLKDNLNDDDFQVVSCTVPDLSKSMCWVNYCKIRAKNAFGAKILGVIIFSIRSDSVISAKSLD